jgi:phthiocerol/phenolphthiocerol synthesis type-I polyketide synthase E
MGVTVNEPLAQPSSTATTADRLRRLWTAILDEDDIAPDADFFDLGGNSFLAMDLMSRVRAEFGVELGIVTLFAHSSLAALATRIDQRVR